MAGCITDDYREILKNMVAEDIAKEVVLGMLTAIPRCPTGGSNLKLSQRSGFQKGYGEVIFFDEKGTKETFSSMSSFIESKGGKISGTIPAEMITICSEDHSSCRVDSSFDIATLMGYEVDLSPKGDIKIYHAKAPNNPVKKR